MVHQKRNIRQRPDNPRAVLGNVTLDRNDITGGGDGHAVGDGE